jgi:hypothetical protein
MPELDALRNIVDNVIMAKAGTYGVTIIRRRVREGIYLDGSSDNATEYSSKPFAMPFGGLQTSALKKQISGMKDNDAPKYFISKSSGNIWILITGGYKQLREIAGKQTDKVTMTWSGRMMRNLKVLPDSATNRSVTVGFDDATAQRIANYHNIDGAGKSKRMHVFMNFTDDEKKKIADMIGDEIANKLVAYNR